MDEYKLTVGLEVHAELATKSKMFCACKNDPLETRPNWNVCPICLGHPGTLPTINQEAVRQVLRMGIALGGTLANFSEFDRKNYFYPDIPKGYQISQYEHPFVTGGALAGVAIIRVHLEEDTGTSIHEKNNSLINFNRAGVPLMELVTEPVIESAKQAADFARELQLLLRYLGASRANMENGEMRVEANISVARTPLKDAPRGVLADLGTKVEVKNLNSFRSVERAIEYEFKRQSELLAAGGQVTQETRGWDEASGETFSQRQKESSHDYRYFPEPDLPKIFLNEVPEFANLASTLPELPTAKRARLAKFSFLKKPAVEQLVNDLKLSLFFDQTEVELQDWELLKVAANIILNDIAGKRKTDPEWLPEFNDFIKKIRSNLPMPQMRSSILGGVMLEVLDPDALPGLVEQIITENPKVISDFRAGKASALQFLIGQGMKLSRGAANPQVLKTALKKRLT